MWFVRSGSRVTGPFTEDELRAMRRRGEFAPIHQISTDRIRWDSAAQLVIKLDGALPDWGGAEWYYVDRDRQQKGPVPEQALRELLQTKRLPKSTLACKAGETRWDRADRHTEFAPFIPANTGRVLAIAASSVLVIGTLTGLVVNYVPRGPVVPPQTHSGGAESKGDPRVSDAKLITSLDDQKRIEEAVGFVVCGWNVRWKDGDVEEIQLSSGSCFAISSDGYLATNKHVVEDMVPRTRMQTEFKIKDYCDHHLKMIILMVKTLQEQNKKFDEDKLKKLISRYNPANYQSVEPKVWVFFGSKEDQYEAEVLHVSSYDMSVLKINRKGVPYFRLADAADLPKLRTEVFALGFPGAAQEAVSDDEELHRKLQRAKNLERIQDQFLPSDFGLSSTAGKVSRVVNETQNGQRIQHDADIKHGNSGGPLVTSDATVIGINTWGVKRGSDSSGVYYALATPQLLKEITRAIEKDRAKASR